MRRGPASARFGRAAIVALLSCALFVLAAECRCGGAAPRHHDPLLAAREPAPVLLVTHPTSTAGTTLAGPRGESRSERGDDVE